VKIGEKIFAGKDIIHIAIWKKSDDRTTYNMSYLDAGTGRTYGKRFNVTGITRDKEYQLGSDVKGSKVLYLTANPNGEAETIHLNLTQSCTAKIKNFDFDFGELAIKGRDSQGNIITKYPVRQIKQKEAGKSTIGARRFWFDDITGRLNNLERGQLLGEFDTGDNLMILYNDGTFETRDTDLNQRFEMKDILYLGKYNPDLIVNVVHYDGSKGWTMVKRFKIEIGKLKEKYSYLTDHPKSKMLFASVGANPRIVYSLKLKGKNLAGEVSLGDFMEPKGWKAVGNRLSDQLLTGIKEIESAPLVLPKAADTQINLFGEEAPLPTKPIVKEEAPKPKPPSQKLKPGDTIEFD
jgi:topoisomerase IV subunit A